MPESPECQILVDAINKEFKGKNVTSVGRLNSSEYCNNIEWLENTRFMEVRRRAKYLIWEFNKLGILPNNFGSRVLYCVNHLAMTGRWEIVTNGSLPPPSSKHRRFYIQFNEKFLIFNDIRKWGRFDVYSYDEFHSNTTLQKRLSSLGPDSLRNEVTLEYLASSLKKKKFTNKEIKPLLLDQEFVSGLGNIYASEVCFLAGISPFKKASQLSLDEVHTLQQSIFPIVDNAYKAGGSSIKNYVHLDGQRGSAQLNYFVYGQKQCKMCNSQIQKAVQNGRSTYHCAKCQS